MDVILYNPSQSVIPINNPLSVVTVNEPNGRKPFLEANTIEASLAEIRQEHIIPVFVKDNEPLISQVEFVETMQEVVQDSFNAERILSPSIRLSHPIKGRIPEARNKPANQLEEWEKTVYYERMAFIIEVPTISDSIDGEPMCLSIGGIKAYNLDNLSNRKGADEHFKLFIGFKVSVCTNMCVFTDGATLDLKVKNRQQLEFAIRHLINGFDAVEQLSTMSRLMNYSLTESQFAQLIGRCRLYQYLPANQKQNIPELQFGDSMVNSVCRDYYRDNSFCRDNAGNINLWRLYNLFTASNKQSYIDTFLDRAVNASLFVGELQKALEYKKDNWFLS